jgi:hypothetical protein
VPEATQSRRGTRTWLATRRRSGARCASPIGRPVRLSFAVDHLDRLIERLHGEPTGGRAQMQSLPDTPGRERRLAIVAVADRDEAGQGAEASWTSRVFLSQAAWLVSGETEKSRA